MYILTQPNGKWELTLKYNSIKFVPSTITEWQRYTYAAFRNDSMCQGDGCNGTLRMTPEEQVTEAGMVHLGREVACGRCGKILVKVSSTSGERLVFATEGGL